MEQEILQTEVNRLLNRGIIFGIIWIMGIGSVIAITSGIQANRIINRSDFKLEGKTKVTQCLLIGGAGIIVLIFAIIFVLIYRKNNL